MRCDNCGRVIYGFWKYGKYHACSKICFRKMLSAAAIPRLNYARTVEVGDPELGMVKGTLIIARGKKAKT